MLSNLKNIFKVPDLRNKILFTILMVILYRFGAHIRVPGIDDQAVRQLRESARQQGALGFLNLFSPSSRWASCPTSRPASSCRCSLS